MSPVCNRPYLLRPRLYRITGGSGYTRFVLASVVLPSLPAICSFFERRGNFRIVAEHFPLAVLASGILRAVMFPDVRRCPVDGIKVSIAGWHSPSNTNCERRKVLSSLLSVGQITRTEGRTMIVFTVQLVRRDENSNGRSARKKDILSDGPANKTVGRTRSVKPPETEGTLLPLSPRIVFWKISRRLRVVQES